MKKIKKSTIVLSVIALTAVLVMVLIIKSRIERQREIELMIQQNQIGHLVRVFNLKDKDGNINIGFGVNKEYCTVEQYYNLQPTDEGDDVIATTQDTIDNLNAFAEKFGIEYDGQICKFTMEELLNDPMRTYKKLEVYNDEIQLRRFHVDIANIADGFYNKDE